MSSVAGSVLVRYQGAVPGCGGPAVCGVGGGVAVISPPDRSRTEAETTHLPGIALGDPRDMVNG